MPVVAFPTQIQRFNMATQQDPSRAERQEYNNTVRPGNVFITVFFLQIRQMHTSLARFACSHGKKKNGKDITVHG